jgi:hypothetical protein
LSKPKLIKICRAEEEEEEDATVLQVYYLTFCVAQHVSGAHHQELTTALTVSGFTLDHGGGSLVGRGLAGHTTTNSTATTMLRRQNQRLLMQL